MTSAIYHDLGLDQTVRVKRDGTIKRGIKVRHEAANLRGKHSGDRLFLSMPRSARGHRFAPSGIPRGVDMTTPPIPHNCDNHLPLPSLDVALPAVSPGKVAPSIRMYWEAADDATE